MNIIYENHVLNVFKSMRVYISPVVCYLVVPSQNPIAA